MSARQELALFISVPVDCVIQQIGSNTTVVEQRVALARGAITGYHFAAAPHLDEKLQEFPLDRFHLPPKASIGLRSRQAGCLFSRAQRGHGPTDRVDHILDMAG